MLATNTIAPEFSLIDAQGNEVRLSDYKGKKVVVYFYPKDHTPGCTKQACAFRDAYEGFKEHDVVVTNLNFAKIQVCDQQLYP